MKKKLIALVLMLVMVLSLLPMNTMAAGQTQQIFWGFEAITSVTQMEVGRNYIFFKEPYATDAVVTGLPSGSAILGYAGTDYKTAQFPTSPSQSQISAFNYYCNQTHRDGYVSVMQNGPGFDGCPLGTIAYFDFTGRRYPSNYYEQTIDDYDGEAWYYGCNNGGVYYVGPFFAYTYNEGEYDAGDITASYKPGREPSGAATVTLDDIDVIVDVDGALVSVGAGFVTFTDSIVNPAENDNTITLSVGGLAKTLTIAAAPEMYSVTVNGGNGGGSFAEGRMVVISASAPEGMVFDKWVASVELEDLDKRASTATFTMPADDVTVTARYRAEGTAPSPDTYTVTFDANGHGTAPNAQTVADGGKATEPTALTAEGYDFGGWYIDAECTVAYDFDTVIDTVDTTGFTLYAKWTKACHDMTKTAANAVSCTADGNVEYYTCSVCGKNFADENGEKELKAEELVVKSEGHDMTKTAANAVSCTADGNVEYYTCSVCGKNFADENGEKELKAEELVVKSEGHEMKEITGKAPTYIADGYKDYYHCSACNTAFSDAEGKTELTASEIKDLVIPQLILVVENKAEVSEGAVDKAISETKEDEDVTLDLTHKDVVGEENLGTVTKVELPVAALETMVEEEKTLTLVKDDATVTLDAKALKAVTEQAEGNTVTLVVKNVETTTLKPIQQAAVESKKVAVTISAELICDQTGEKIATKDGKGFGGGAVTVAVTVPEELPEGIKASDLKVFYVADDGTVEHLSSKLEGDKIVFTLKHFSEYVIAADAPSDPITPPTGDNTNMAMFITLAVISAVAIVLLIAAKEKVKARYI